MYTKELMNHFSHPHNQGQIKSADGVGQVGNIRCGDIMKVYIKVKKNKKGEEYLDDVKFETLGCTAAIAASSVLTDLAKGKTLKDSLAISKDDIVKELVSVPPLKYHCSILAEEALKKAVENYKKSKK